MKKFYDKSQIQILQTSKQTNSSVSQIRSLKQFFKFHLLRAFVTSSLRTAQAQHGSNECIIIIGRGAGSRKADSS